MYRDDTYPRSNEPLSEMDRLKRELRREALTRLEDAARTETDFRRVVEWWDKNDANRERRERYHEISRSGDEFPLDYGAQPDAISFPNTFNPVWQRQIRAGDFIDVIFHCPYEICELVTEEYISCILDDLKDDSKKLLFMWAVLQFSTAKIAAIREQTDRNIRKVRDTMIRSIQKKLLAALKSGVRQQQEMTGYEKRLLAGAAQGGLL